jgi:hypothetical protein
MELGHLRREIRTALELAVVALAPSNLIDGLAAVAGLLEALVELPPKSPPVLALVPALEKRSKKVLDEWQKWKTERLPTGKA